MPLYGILDGARNDGIYPLVLSEPEAVCLFAGDLDPVLRRAAPHLVRLALDGELMTAWRERGWSDHWGIICSSKLKLSPLRKKFRQFLQVSLPEGDVVIFRFYDPRVFNAYLPTCDHSELVSWFSDVDEYRTANESGNEVISYAFRENELVTTHNEAMTGQSAS